ncbi:hypothetical protein [Kitasatospora sp. NPDC090308]|uniref:hypothetical protein n=1 Tax=Kitasatospora sp. NPDC090308 TaxID=3364082 RepID=UPI00382FC1E2
MDAAFTLAWQHSVGLVFPENLPRAAAELMAEGQDSPALRDLAGRSGNEDTAELQGLLQEAMGELCVPVPDGETAERCLLHHLAARLTAGDITPKDVAATLWYGIADTGTDLESQFARAATEEDYLDAMETNQPEAFRSWENALRAAAITLAAAENNPLKAVEIQPDRALPGADAK